MRSFSSINLVLAVSCLSSAASCWCLTRSKSLERLSTFLVRRFLSDTRSSYASLASHPVRSPCEAVACGCVACCSLLACGCGSPLQCACTPLSPLVCGSAVGGSRGTEGLAESATWALSFGGGLVPMGWLCLSKLVRCCCCCCLMARQCCRLLIFWAWSYLSCLRRRNSCCRLLSVDCPSPPSVCVAAAAMDDTTVDTTGGRNEASVWVDAPTEKLPGVWVPWGASWSVGLAVFMSLSCV
mmetsp:Transcript_22282/g.54891  ORF Transcript_22282/g.54891 Transcript_22282/m.54891 type:complete len:240 (+) Transcript_22282:708-1427(+)